MSDEGEREALLLCPHCGGNAELSNGVGTTRYITVGCLNEDCEAPRWWWRRDEKTEHEAAIAWNTRAKQPQPTGESARPQLDDAVMEKCAKAVQFVEDHGERQCWLENPTEIAQAVIETLRKEGVLQGSITEST